MTNAPEKTIIEVKLLGLPQMQHALRDMQYELDSLDAEKNNAYAERNKCLVLTARLAQKLGLTAGIGVDTSEHAEPEWRGVLFIDLPSGQVSWHLHDDEVPMFSFLPVYDGVWDGHTTDEKYQRVLEPRL